MKLIYEREGAGRYMLRFGYRNLRAGLVLGGYGKWVAESLNGVVLGSRKTRKKAARLIVLDQLRKRITKSKQQLV